MKKRTNRSKMRGRLACTMDEGATSADPTLQQPVPVEIEGIIFDLDGTLIDYEGASNAALAVPLTKRGKQFSWELHAQIVGTKPEDWSRKIVEAVGLGAPGLGYRRGEGDHAACSCTCVRTKKYT